MNIVTNSGFKVWPTVLSQRPESASAPEQSEFASSSQPSAESRTERPTDTSIQVTSRSDNAPETQAFLMRVQESAASSDTNTSSAVEDTQTLLDGLSAKAMRVSVSGTTAIVSFSDGSRPLTLNLALGSVTLSFADGTTAQVMAQTPSRKLEAVYEAEEEASRSFVKVA